MAAAKKSKKMTLDQARRLLKRYDWVTPAYFRGYEWVKAKYKPAVELLSAERRRKSDHELAGQAWYVIGDIHDFNNAPKAAIRAYRKCLKLIPWQTAGHREIGSMLDRIGEYDKARRIWKQGLRIDPDDECEIQYDLDSMEEDLVLPGENIPLYQAGDLVWEARELLSTEKPKAALRKVLEVDTQCAERTRSHIYCVLGEFQKAHAEWEKIAIRPDEFCAEWPELHYLYNTLMDTASFWELIDRMARDNRCENMWDVKGIEKAIPYPQKPRYESKTQKDRLKRRQYLVIQWELIRTRKDIMAAQKLVKKYPDWPAAKDLLKYLKTGKW